MKKTQLPVGSQNSLAEILTKAQEVDGWSTQLDTISVFALFIAILGILAAISTLWGAPKWSKY